MILSPSAAKLLLHGLFMDSFSDTGISVNALKEITYIYIVYHLMSCFNCNIRDDYCPFYFFFYILLYCTCVLFGKFGFLRGSGDLVLHFFEQPLDETHSTFTGFAEQTTLITYANVLFCFTCLLKSRELDVLDSSERTCCSNLNACG